jgi:hypothetical protein
MPMVKEIWDSLGQQPEMGSIDECSSAQGQNQNNSHVWVS